MSDTDDREDGGTLVPFPRVVLPGSFDAPGSGPGPSAEGALAAEEPAAIGTWPRLPAVAEMRPPLHLTVPGTPAPEPAADEDGGVFTPPSPEDPDNPTVQETLAVAVALMTALGVAVARAIWQRAQERQARAERARGGAGRTSGDGAGAGSGGGRATRSAGGSSSKGSSPSLLRSPGGTSPKKKAPGGGGGSKPPGGGKGPSGSRKGRPDGKGGPGSKAPKATRDGRRKDQDKPGRKKDGTDKGDVGKRLRRGIEKLKRAKSTPDSKSPGARGRRLVWKAPKDGSEASDRKRWSRRTGTSGENAGKRRSAWRSAFTWVKRWRAGRRKADDTPSPSAPSDPTASTAEAPGAPEGEPGTPTDPPPSPPPPPPGGGWTSWMRPPPWADRRTWVRVERVDHPAEPAQPEPEALALAGAPAAGRPALPAGPPPSPTPAPQQERATFVSTPVKTTSTQYADAELTVGDVIEADADMASEITDGVSEALATAAGCERLLTRLEALHAKVVELQVPGSLEGMVVELMELTTVVKARSEAIAAKLPAAAEAIATAGSNAESRHKPLADAVRDAGHIRPAEREYHDQ